MIDPVTIGLTATAISGIGAAVSAGGSIFGGIAGYNMGKYQAGVAEMNAKIAEQNASYERAVGEVQAQQSGMKTAAIVGSTIATQGASGLAVGSGSNERVVESEYEIGSEDQAVIRSNAARRAYGDEVIATQDRAQAQLDTMSADNSLIAGGIGAFSSILGGGGSFSSKWLQGTGKGLFGGSSLPNVTQGGLY